MDGQPGHFLACPGVDEDITYEPVHQEQAEWIGFCNRAYDADHPKDHSNLLVQWNEHEVVIPGLGAPCYLLLLDPVVEALPDAIPDTAANISEFDGKQYQENAPCDQNGKKPVRPGHSDNRIEYRLKFRIDPSRKAAPSLWRNRAEHLAPENAEHIDTKQDTNPGYKSHGLVFQPLHKRIGKGLGFRIGSVDRQIFQPAE